MKSTPSGKPAYHANLEEEAALCIQEQIALLQMQIDQANLIIASLIGLDFAKQLRTNQSPIDPDVRFAISNLILGMGISTNSLTILLKTPGLPTRDAYPIARTILETAVNICYILAVGKGAALRAVEHAKQKTHRDFDRESAIGATVIRLKFGGKLEAQDDDLKDLIDRFTHKSGREKSWIDISIDQRIEIAAEKFGENFLTKFHFARFIIYRHSSEIIHGTLFGSLFFMGLTNPSLYKDLEARGMEDFSKQLGEQSILILLAANFAVSCVTEAFHLSYGFPEPFTTSKRLIDEMFNIPWFKRITEKHR